MNENKLKKSIIIINALLIFGLVIYAIIFFIINKNLNLADFSGNYEVGNQRLLWRGFAEAICSLFGIVYIVGHILVIHSAMKKLYIPFWKMLAYFVVQVGIMFVCVIPFAIFDLSYLGDYVFPIWNIAGMLLLVLVIYSLVYFYRKNIQLK